MKVSTWMRWGLMLVAGCGLWLMYAGPEQLLGWGPGLLDSPGELLLYVGTLVLLYRVSQLPREALAQSASLAEWKARLGVGFIAIAMAYFFAKMHVFNGAPIPHNPDATAVGRNLVMLLISWWLLSRMLTERWKGSVEEDERDREIAVQAAGWGRGALIFSIVGIAVMLSFTPAEKLEWATPLMIGNLLIFALMWGWLCEYVAILAHYWKDRRGEAR